MREEDNSLAQSIRHILTERTWLSGEAISEFMIMLSEQRNGVATIDPLVLSVYRETGGNLNAISRLLKRTRLEDKRIVIAPLNKCNHWILIVAWLVKREVSIFDSLKGLTSSIEDSQNLIKILYTLDETLDNDERWQIKECKTPQQSNSHDCGVFMLACAEYISRGCDIDFNQSNMDSFRFQLGKQIYRGKLTNLNKIAQPGEKLYPLVEATPLDYSKSRHLSVLKDGLAGEGTRMGDFEEMKENKKRDQYPFSYPKIRSLNPASKESFLEPVMRASVQGGFSRNCEPRDHCPTVSNCPREKLEENLIRCIVNHNPTRLLSVFIIFESPDGSIQDFPDSLETGRWVDLRLAAQLEPKWKLFDYLRSVFLFDCARWNHVLNRARKQEFDIERFISDECRMALDEYNKSIKKYTSSRQYLRDLKLMQQRGKNKQSIV